MKHTFSREIEEALALFPDLPTVQVLITCGMQKLQAIKNWRVGRPGNGAKEREWWESLERDYGNWMAPWEGLGARLRKHIQEY